ncbi:MAG: alpha/beta hydrolase [Candidatus Hydrogenedentes bacterium]|nr:alpha/beta hydrolase [Candidatus Hydrogenedentota bacterium]
MNRKRLKLLAALFVIVLLAGTGIAWAIGSDFSLPQRVAAGIPPNDLDYEKIEFASPSGSAIAGWYFPAADPIAGVVLLHGVRSNRRGVTNRVPFLHTANYAALAIDFQAHGESAGDHITFGYLERHDARAAVEWLRGRLPGKKVAVIGESMGAAAAVMNGSGLGADALVIETMYPSLSEAVNNRMRDNLGRWGPAFSWVLLAQTKPRLGFWCSELCPIFKIEEIHAPTFVIAGEKDTYTLLDESKRIFERAREPKEFWSVENAKHEDMWVFAKGEYEHHVLDFLSRALKSE